MVVNTRSGAFLLGGRRVTSTLLTVTTARGGAVFQLAR